MIVRLTAEAENDLEQIGDYIAQDNPKRALSFVRTLRDKCLGLADAPYGFPLVLDMSATAFVAEPMAIT